MPAFLLLSQTGISNTRIIFHTPSPHRILDNGLGILTLFPSTTLLSLALGADSPCSDERRAGNLGLTASGLQHASQHTFAGLQNAPLPLILTYESAASVTCLAPLHLPRRKTRSVSYYAFFKGWLLLSQLPDCLSLSTSFST